MLHVLNGDATLHVLARAGIAGETLVWRDILVEGPPAPPSDRAPYLASRFGIDAREYLRGREAAARALEAARAHDEVTLWFEQDLFCAVNLWFLLDRLAPGGARPRLSLVFPAGTGDGPGFRGLGALEPSRLPPLFASRVALDPPALELARRAWAAYAGPDPRALEPFAALAAPALPFVNVGARLHLGRFPAPGSGLNEVEAGVLQALGSVTREFSDLLGVVGAADPVRLHGMGDVQLAAYVRDLAAGGLVTIGGDPGDASTWRLSVTARGHDVVAGCADWLATHPLDRWLGGVRLAPGGRAWRWDGAGHRLLEA